MTVVAQRDVGGASDRKCGSCAHVRLFSSSCLPVFLSEVSSSGREEGGLLSQNTVGWDGVGVGGLTGKLCLAIFNSWDTTWLMVFLDPPARRSRTSFKIIPFKLQQMHPSDSCALL